MTRAALAGLLVATLAACIGEPRPPGASECKVTADCNVGAGEVCDEGVCWGDPPAGVFAATLGPPAAAEEIAGTTELAELALQADGWFGDARTGALTLAPSLKVIGRIKAPCPGQLASCSGFLGFGGSVRWSRASTLPGGDRVTVPVTATADGYQLYLPRPTAPTTYTVSVVPSTEPLGPGLPAPAQFFAPQRFTVTINPTDPEVGVERDFLFGSAATRTLAGRIARASGTLAGWRVHAEASDADSLGTYQLASNIAVTSSTGEFSLTLPEGVSIADVVVEPPAPPSRNDIAPPSLRVRDHVVTSALPVLEIPAVDRLVSVPVTVTGKSGSGDQVGVAAAAVRARLDQQLPSGLFLRYETTATTSPDGVASLQVFLGSAAQPLRYEVDVLPGPQAELATRYGVELVLRDTVPTPPPVELSRRVAVVGTLRDEAGFPLAATTVSASVSGASLCALSSTELRAARALAPAQDTSNARGEFKLWVDPDLAGTELRYDLVVEPSVGTWAPRWTFPDRTIEDGDTFDLWLPPAAHVRGRVEAPGGLPVPDTVVSVYQVAPESPPCQQAAGGTYMGGLELRAIGVSDEDGVVRVILPRFTAD